MMAIYTIYWTITCAFLLGGATAFLWPRDPDETGFVQDIGLTMAGLVALLIGLGMAGIGWLAW